MTYHKIQPFHINHINYILVSFPKGCSPTWDEFRISYRCVKCDSGCLTNVACFNEGVVSDGVGSVAVGNGNIVAGGSRDGGE
jgi:hypothetical protein